MFLTYVICPISLGRKRKERNSWGSWIEGTNGMNSSNFRCDGFVLFSSFYTSPLSWLDHNVLRNQTSFRWLLWFCGHMLLYITVAESFQLRIHYIRIHNHASDALNSYFLPSFRQLYCSRLLTIQFYNDCIAVLCTTCFTV
jgi:hypothetical protein